jgi:hypothetical protein
MTDPKPLPSAARILGEAISIALDPSSGDLALRRGELLYSIARELREEAQFRRTSERLASFAPTITPPPAPKEPKTVTYEEMSRMARQFQNAAATSRPGDTDLITQAAARTLRMDATQHLRALSYKLGDKADCRHCHTPIVYAEAGTAGYPEMPGLPAPWRHKYTGQAACSVPMTAGDIEGSEPTHTFAEPQQ